MSKKFNITVRLGHNGGLHVGISVKRLRDLGPALIVAAKRACEMYSQHRPMPPPRPAPGESESEGVECSDEHCGFVL